MSRVIGLTGGIGTGKSTASDYLSSKGYKVIDADKIGWELTEEGSPMLNILNKVFGPDGELGISGIRILDEEGRLLRKALASVVFSDQKKTDKLNSIMFSNIISRIGESIDKINSADPHALIIVDAPLLYEAGADSLCDSVILVTADPDIRIKRVCQRDGISERDVRQRIDRQMSEEEKIRRSDHIIDNSGDLTTLYKKIDELCENIIDKAHV